MHPLTLPDPRHEAFATHLASGHDPVTAYLQAGFSAKNANLRSRQLARSPEIVLRTAHLRTCLPQIAELRDRFAPSLLLMPQTREEMLVWLWQIMNGSRPALPLQFRAAALYCRLQGWHLNRPNRSSQTEAISPAESASSEPALSDTQRALLASLNRQTLASDLTGLPPAEEALTRFTSLMADLHGLTAQAPTPQPANPSLTEAPPASLADHPPLPISSPSQSPDSQALAPTPSPNGEKSALPLKTPHLPTAARPKPPIPALRLIAHPSSFPDLHQPSKLPPRKLC
ncbi:hypothetical protein GCM10023213_24550 [Prosthecobacter algae]|uniref:Uncharacterized protein n=1 Tax=Prosthecobacter algae TaxID=1144682 RepID=A0ABP9PA53_9BACT